MTKIKHALIPYCNVTFSHLYMLYCLFDLWFYDPVNTFSSCRTEIFIILPLILKFSGGYRLLQHPQPCFPLDPTCHLHILCIYIAKFRWPKGTLGPVGGGGGRGGGRTYFKINLKIQNTAFYSGIIVGRTYLDSGGGGGIHNQSFDKIPLYSTSE